VRWLEQDLAYLGKNGEAENAPPPFLPSISSTSELLGVSYVVEGSALGGRALYPRLCSRWGIERHRGASFLFGYGADTSRRWQAFVAALNRVVLDEREENRCIAAARQMFTGLTEWFAHEQAAACGRRNDGAPITPAAGPDSTASKTRCRTTP
jgi:heme oxygenase